MTPRSGGFGALGNESVVEGIAFASVGVGHGEDREDGREESLRISIHNTGDKSSRAQSDPSAPVDFL